MLEYKPERIDE
jgi:hypothetical protein